MAAYSANGAQLGWLLFPEQQAVEIWQAAAAVPQRLEPATQLDAGNVLPGLRLDLAEVWAV
jgi:Uma2 family endonuclease